MGYIIVQYDDRPIHPNCKTMMAINKMYCAIHGYKYKFKSTHIDVDKLPPYWIKVQLVIDILDKYPDCDGVLWLDTDACVYDLNRSLDSFSGNFVCSSESIMYTGMNAGVWIVKNTEHGRTIMKIWMSYYIKDNWVLEDKWICKVGEWAGVSYEQGAFNINILEQYKEILNINRVKWNILNNISSSYTEPEISFTYHFCGGRYKNQKRFDLFKKNILLNNHDHSKKLKKILTKDTKDTRDTKRHIQRNINFSSEPKKISLLIQKKRKQIKTTERCLKKNLKQIQQ